jgi:hypothetical protein
MAGPRASFRVDDAHTSLLASYMTDALGDLLSAAVALADGSPEERVSWVEEPGCNEWVLTRTGNALRVQVLHYEGLTPNHLGDVGIPKLDASCRCPAFLTAIHEGAEAVISANGPDGYRKRWRNHDFPVAHFDALTSRLPVEGRPGAYECPGGEHAVTLTAPSRVEAEAWWRAVLAGSVTREAGHDWAEPLMLADYGTEVPDVFAMSALQYLHGFDMTSTDAAHRFIAHSPPGEYVKTMADIRADLDRWLANCRDYDADPEGWIERVRRRARDAK